MKIVASTAVCLAALLVAGTVHGQSDREQVSLDELIARAVECNKDLPPLDFVTVQDIAVNRAVEDDIRANLAVLGISVNARLMTKDERNTAVDEGDFHLTFSESYGPPYDPHGYASGWIDGAGGDGHHAAFAGIDHENLYDLIRQVIASDTDKKGREAMWKVIHETYHQEAVMLPLWGKDVPALINTRLTGYESGHQQFDYVSRKGQMFRMTPIPEISNILRHIVVVAACPSIGAHLGRLGHRHHCPRRADGTI